MNFNVTDLDWNFNGLETGKLSVYWLRQSIEFLAQEKRWVDEYEESISIEDLQTRKSYKALDTADITLTPSWKRKKC